MIICFFNVNIRFLQGNRLVLLYFFVLPKYFDTLICFVSFDNLTFFLTFPYRLHHYKIEINIFRFEYCSGQLNIISSDHDDSDEEYAANSQPPRITSVPNTSRLDVCHL